MRPLRLPVLPFQSLIAMLVLLLLTVPAEGEVEAPESSRYACWMLEEALEDLREQGLELIYSSDLVRAGMQITEAPSGGAPRQVLGEILAPFGLGVKEGEQGVLLVVRAASVAPATGSPSSGARPISEEGVLPRWIDAGGLVERRFPSRQETPPAISATSSVLVFRVVDESLDKTLDKTVDESFDDWAGAAFELKNRILDARAAAPQVRVALEGRASTLEELVHRGLAPYVDAYVYRDLPFVPASDPTARHWYRTAAEPFQVLPRLLAAADRGDELVIFDGPRLSPEHQAFLARIQATRSGALDVQPEVEGIDRQQVQFFLDPETGNHLLAVYGDAGGNEIRFDLIRQQRAELLFPVGAPYRFLSAPGASQLDLDGSSSHYLFELTLEQADPNRREVEVSDTAIVDPYEEVVKNQVFQERRLEQFESLDVMEYITNIPQYPGADQITWEHRILERKGRLADYHHLGYSRNGVRYPEKKLLKGRLFRNEALLQLDPLEVELDETYRYAFLGVEEVGGHRTYKIGYSPLRQGTVEGGNFVSGIVWLDVKTSAHRRLRTVQKGLEGALISQERTYSYSWIPSGGQCFWDWRRRSGTYVVSSLGEQYSTLTETERVGFEFNRPDIEQVAQEAYASDLLIHVETPPEGHRWLVKTEEGGRRLAPQAPAPARWASGPTAYAESTSLQGMGAGGLGSDGSGGGSGVAADGGNDRQLTDEPPGYGGRTLADIHAFSTRTSFSLFSQGSGDSVDLYPGLTISDQDFLDRGYQAYAGFFLEDAVFSLSFPNLFEKNWILTARLFVPYSAELRGSSSLIDGTLRDTSVKTRQDSLTLSLAVPLSRRFSLGAGYTLSQLGFEAVDSADPAFVSPGDTREHLVDLSINGRFGALSTELGIELATREDWQPWGIDGSEPLLEDYRVLRASVARPWRIAEHQSLSAGAGYWKGWDLDRFSRLRNGRARAGLPGFDNNLGFDEAVLLNLSWGTHIAKLPINLRFDHAFELLEEYRAQGFQERVSLSFRFLINGPFRLDVWPSVHYLAYSDNPDETGDVTFGLFLRRRQ